MQVLWHIQNKGRSKNWRREGIEIAWWAKSELPLLRQLHTAVCSSHALVCLLCIYVCVSVSAVYVHDECVLVLVWLFFRGANAQWAMGNGWPTYIQNFAKHVHYFYVSFFFLVMCSWMACHITISLLIFFLSMHSIFFRSFILLLLARQSSKAGRWCQIPST